ncbi:peptide ABC transporter ATP-binding protein [Cohnella sp. CIP 111063]|jgi:oligopeptide/dipeptide ABC transporter, ATP-binding protein, C-terminal domain|uniref:ABC transporter ATP-binding protein n=1 Tax=unclassified Cohnella TaxID=2636738 RepID=UPI000B8C09A4|nr:MULTISPECIES: ABC transporter ATP-binding protein [unclassified Cohnella]OXS62632.1 peptide ABC transporter ATP-binding protein [Cohnella sp. CIP 111063]PRX74891.1 oligopeptide transport system ATP-binding protein [Cohnella sp. SGD-V74]
MKNDPDTRKTILDVKNLSVSFDVYGGEVQAVRDVSFHIKEGEAVAIVGESGSGKSVTAQTIMRLIQMPPGRIKGGQVLLGGQDLMSLSEKEMQKVRGNKIGMIFQDPMTSLNPTMTVGKQIMEGLLQHQKISRDEAKERVIELLRMVGIPNPETRLNQYPHQFSGGMRQRVVIAIALACNPSLLIADEPTTALDVTIQAQILSLMKELQQKMKTSIILITHDLGIVADICDRVIVMYAGQVIETGTKREIFNNPQHPYTKGLLKSLPRLDQAKDEPLIPIFGTPPDLIKPPQGCGFCSRCDEAMRICETEIPDYTVISGTQSVRCWLQHPYAKQSGSAGGKEASV